MNFVTASEITYPVTFEEEDTHPFQMRIVDAVGVVVWTSDRQACSSKMRSTADVYFGVGFRGQERIDVHLANQQQMINMRNIVAAMNEAHTAHEAGHQL